MTPPTTAASLPAALPTARKFLILGVLAFGMFMALLDIQIVAASLNDIQAGLSAGPDEISWVQTAYLMAELVMIPLAAYLARALSTRWLFVASAALFTASSLACGFAWNIQSMIAFRVLQGFTGGAMVPTVFAVAYTLFTGKQRALIPAILGMVSVLAPTLGPAIGGYITQSVNWHWIFFINLAPGIAIALAASRLVRLDAPNLQLLKQIDWTHLAALAVFLGTLEYVLEEGPRLDWFGDPRIQIAAWLSVVGFALFLERSFYSPSPVVRLSPFAKPSFVFACIFNLVIGFGMYSATYLTPVYLGRVRGFDSLQIGETVFVVGITQLASTVISARLAESVDRRLVITVGLVLFAVSLWMTSALTPAWGFNELLLPQLVRGLAVMLCIVPAVGMALTPFTGAELGAASGLFNLMRNLGGAIGIAVVNTWLQDNTRIELAHLSEALGHQAAAATDTVASLAQRLSAATPDAAQALELAKGLFGANLTRQALTLAFDDVFRLMAWTFLAALVLVPFARVRGGGAPGTTDVH